MGLWAVMWCLHSRQQVYLAAALKLRMDSR